MKKLHYLGFIRTAAFAILLTTFIPKKLTAQQAAVKSRPEDYIFYGGDTLTGFDLNSAYNKAKADNDNDAELRRYMFGKERMFIYAKYHLAFANSHGKDPLHALSRYGSFEDHGTDGNRHFEKEVPPSITKASAYKNALSSGCNNLDFSDGNYTNWTGIYGYNGYDDYSAGGIVEYYSNWTLTSAQLNAQETTPPSSNLTPMTKGLNAAVTSCSWVTLCNGGTDPCGGFPMVCPGFTNSVRLGGVNVNMGVGYGSPSCGKGGTAGSGSGTDDDGSSGYYTGQGEYLSQAFKVNSSNCLLTVNYAVVLNDGGHINGEQPFVIIQVTDSVGNPVNCDDYYQENTAGVAPAGYTKGTSLNTGDNSACYYLPWTALNFDLHAYLGKTLSIQLMAVGCEPGAHFAYAYFDMSCGPAQLTVTNPSCGVGTITAPAGNSYSWTGPCITSGATSQTVNVSCSGTYSCTVNPTGATGCTYVIDSAVTVSSSSIILASTTLSTICTGQSATLTASGAGTSGTYTWAPSTGLNSTTDASVIATPTTGVTYTVTGTSASLGCTGTQTVTVNVNASAPPSISISGASVVCSGSGTLLTASGADTYVWSAGSATSSSANTVSPTVNTSYTVTGTSNSTGCQNTATQSITVDKPSVNINPSSASACPGIGKTLTASGGTTYAWNTGGTYDTIVIYPRTNITYSVTGTDANNCSAKATSVITVPTLTVYTTASSVCSGGTVILSASGANTYNWSTGADTSVAFVKPTTTTRYYVTGITPGGCTDTASILITVNNPIITFTPATPGICNGSSAIITANGATTYSWNTGSTKDTINADPSLTTTYTVTGTTAGCSTSASVTLTVGTLTVTAVASKPTICQGDSTVLTAGGAATFLWSNNSTNSAITIKPSSNATYTVTGSSGLCNNTATVSVAVKSTPTVSITGTTTVCSGIGTTLTAQGADMYVWTGGPSTASNSVNPTNTATYTVTGTYTLTSCSSTATQLVTVNSLPTISITANTINICRGSGVTLTANGADTYVWTNGPATAKDSVSPTTTATYTVTGTNTITGCQDTASQAIIVNTMPAITLTGKAASCSGVSDTLSATGGTAYAWSTGSSSSSILVTPSTTTIYTVSITNGVCVKDTSISVTPNALPVVHISGHANKVCGAADTLTAIPTGNAPFTYYWAYTGSTSNQSATPFAGVTYTVYVTDSLGCKSTGTFKVSDSITFVPICLVTVDSTSSHTIITWNNPGLNSGLDSLYLSRDSVPNNPIARFGANDYSQFIDTLYGMNPQLHTYSYGLQGEDGCGRGGAVLTMNAKTIHLTVTPNACGNTLNWTKYYGYFPFTEYYVYRDSANTGWKYTDSVYEADLTWTDTICYGSGVDIGYYVGAVDRYSCVASTHGVSTVTISRSNSYHSNTGLPTNVTQLVNNNFISVFPNPADNVLNVIFTNNFTGKESQVKIVDVLGKEIMKTTTTVTNNKIALDISTLASGLYFVNVITDKGNQVVKFIKQ